MGRREAAESAASARPAALDTVGKAPVLADMGDLELSRRASAGNREAFGELVTRHRRTVYRVCYRFAGNHEDAADLAQDVFLRAYRAIGKFKGQSSVSTWLYRIAVNAGLNHVSARRPAVEPLEGPHDVDAEAEPTDARLVREERAARVRAAIAQLPPQQRATLILRVFHDLPHDEIASVLGNSVGAGKANLFHALRNLRRLLGEGKG